MRIAALFICIIMISVPAQAEESKSEVPKAESAPKSMSAPKGTVAALDAKNGFREVTFGTNVKIGKEWVKVDEGKGLTIVTRTSDRKELGKAKLEGIAYGLYEGKVIVITIIAKGDNASAVLEALGAAYGEPEQPNKFIKDYIWRGSQVVLSYSLNEFSGVANCTMVSIPLYEEYQQKQKQAAAAAADDL
jgi:hypothetical protein